MLYLTGNYHADIQCEKNTTNPGHNINLKATVLPRFVILHKQSREIISSAFNKFIKTKQNQSRILEFQTDHPEAEDTRFNKEID